MNTYKAYHTNLKQLAKKGNLPDYYVQEIDISTIWRWKQEESDKYFGNELSNLEVLDQFISRKEAQKIMRSCLRVAYSISHILNETNLLHSSLRNNLTQFVKTITRYKDEYLP
jgi:putative transposase